MMKMIVSGFLLLCSLSVQADDVTIIAVDSSRPEFVVTLPANPTTGYQWTLTSYDKKNFKVTGSQFISPRTRLMGAGGKMTFTFVRHKSTIVPKSTQMTFTYARSWDKTRGSVKHVRVDFVNNVRH